MISLVSEGGRAGRHAYPEARQGRVAHLEDCRCHPSAYLASPYAHHPIVSWSRLIPAPHFRVGLCVCRPSAGSGTTTAAADAVGRRRRSTSSSQNAMYVASAGLIPTCIKASGQGSVAHTRPSCVDGGGPCCLSGGGRAPYLRRTDAQQPSRRQSADRAGGCPVECCS